MNTALPFEVMAKETRPKASGRCSASFDAILRMAHLAPQSQDACAESPNILSNEGTDKGDRLQPPSTGAVVSQRFRWAVLAIAWFSSVVALISLQSPSPLLAVFVQHFGISYADAGFLVTLFALPGVFAVLFGPLADRFGTRKPGAA